jgi:uncharacterized protein
MNTGVLKVVLDTNVLVSMIGRTSPNRWIFDKILVGELVLCISHEIALEYEEVLARKTTPEIASNFAEFLANFPYVEHSEVHFQWNLIENDPDDNKSVDCAVAANAYCIGQFPVTQALWRGAFCHPAGMTKASPYRSATCATAPTTGAAPPHPKTPALLFRG